MIPSLWSYIIDGIIKLIQALFLSNMPAHTPIGLMQQVVNMASSSLGVTYMIIFSNIDMTFSIVIFGICATLEVIHVVYAGWRWIKRIVI